METRTSWDVGTHGNVASLKARVHRTVYKKCMLVFCLDVNKDALGRGNRLTYDDYCIELLCLFVYSLDAVAQTKCKVFL